jgi:hypothetical protein
MSAPTAVAAIEAALDLSAPAYRTARRLLDRAGSTGVLWLAMADALRLAATDSPNTLRRHLSDLAGAGVVGYQIDGGAGVWVRFLAFGVITQCAEPITQCASVITQCATHAPTNGNGAHPAITQCAEPITQCAEPITQCAQNPPIPPLVGWLDPDTDPDPEPTNQPEPGPAPEANAEAGPPAIDPAEHARSYALLIDPDVGVAPRTAQRLASEVTFEELLRYVAAWSADYAAGRVRSTGALVARIERVQGAPPVSGAFRQSELYGRHVSSSDEWRRKYAPPWLRGGEDPMDEPVTVDDGDDAPPAPLDLDHLPDPDPDAPEADTDALDDLWRQVDSELAASLPSSTYDTWLRDARLVSCVDGEALIHLPNRYAVEWLENRLGARLRRLISQLAGQRLAVRFAVAPAGAAIQEGA